MHRGDVPPADERVLRIRREYAQAGLDRGWTHDEFLRLCNQLECLPRHLAEMCCISPGDYHRWSKANLFPRHVSLIFAMIQGSYLQLKGRPIIPVPPIWLLKQPLSTEAHHD